MKRISIASIKRTLAGTKLPIYRIQYSPKWEMRKYMEFQDKPKNKDRTDFEEMDKEHGKVIGKELFAEVQKLFKKSSPQGIKLEKDRIGNVYVVVQDPSGDMEAILEGLTPKNAEYKR